MCVERRVGVERRVCGARYNVCDYSTMVLWIY